jgi:hypothetical protein
MKPLTEINDLASLRHHWGSAYEITTAGPASWRAVRKDGKGQVRADSADTLLVAIRLDYGTAPVPRQEREDQASEP